jgi:transcriptional regulator with XRE-family HTH domain
MAAIEKRGENSYRLTVSCGYDKQGKQIMKRKTLDLSHLKPNKQMEEAEKQFILFSEEVEKGLYLDAGKITFEDFVDKWLKDYAEHELAPMTLHRYKGLLDSRILPALGHIKLNKLQPTHLTEFYNNLRENGIRLDRTYTPKDNFNEIILKSRITMDDILMKSNVNRRMIQNIENHKSISSDVALKICKSIGININTIFDEKNKDGGLSDSISKADKEQYLLDEVNFHGLRHTSATILISQNTDPETVSKRLGHARTSTTMDIYSHALQKSDEVASDKLENLLIPKSSRSKKQG